MCVRKILNYQLFICCVDLSSAREKDRERAIEREREIERQIINKDKMGETVKVYNERERVRETLSRVAQLFTQKNTWDERRGSLVY